MNLVVVELWSWFDFYSHFHDLPPFVSGLFSVCVLLNLFFSAFAFGIYFS